jgi:hypothetical protein
MRHWSYDLLVFGSWRRRGILVDGEAVAVPGSFKVWGFNFAPMYNLNYKCRVGLSLDGVYDTSANIYYDNVYSDSKSDYRTPSINQQLALGLSARAEYVMPIFTVGIGIGTNVLHAGGDLDAFYQILNLKAFVTRNLFLNVGYSLNEFHDPRFLMLGLGVRLNNRVPSLR